MRAYLALPSHDKRYWGNTLMSVLHTLDPAADSDVEVFPDPLSGSVLPRVFNAAVLNAVQGGFDCLAMLHADVAAEPGWLSMLWEEMQEHDADVISAVVPIKDEWQWTSTGVHTTDEHNRRLMLVECHEKLPKTFDIDAPWLREIGAHMLLLNTGCMLLRVTEPWLRKWAGFQFRSCINWDGDGAVGQQVCTSEDWDMSEQLASLVPQPKLMATTAVRVHHWGAKEWGSHR